MSRKAAPKPITKPRGGKRPGAGRKRKYDEPVETRAINLPPQAWAMLDAQRGTLTESEWVMAQILKGDLR